MFEKNILHFESFEKMITTRNGFMLVLSLMLILSSIVMGVEKSVISHVKKKMPVYTNPDPERINDVITDEEMKISQLLARR